MKQLLLVLLLVVLSPASYGELVTRNINETAKDFAERNTPPESNLVHQVIETALWGENKVVIAFYEEDFGGEGCQDCKQIVGYVYLPQGGEYKKTLIHHFEQEGGNPKIESVFFANANNDRIKEIIVIVSWPVDHYDVSGTLYGTYVFGLPQADSSRLTFLKDVSSKLDGGCECWRRDGPQEKARYKTAAEVKVGLKKLGFK